MSLRNLVALFKYFRLSGNNSTALLVLFCTLCIVLTLIEFAILLMSSYGIFLLIGSTGTNLTSEIPFLLNDAINYLTSNFNEKIISLLYICFLIIAWKLRNVAFGLVMTCMWHIDQCYTELSKPTNKYSLKSRIEKPRDNKSPLNSRNIDSIVDTPSLFSLLFSSYKISSGLILSIAALSFVTILRASFILFLAKFIILRVLIAYCFGLFSNKNYKQNAFSNDFIESSETEDVPGIWNLLDLLPKSYYIEKSFHQYAKLLANVGYRDINRINGNLLCALKDQSNNSSFPYFIFSNSFKKNLIHRYLGSFQ